MKLKTDMYKLFYKGYLNIKYKLEVNFNDFNPKRKDAYILIGNHPSINDGLLQTLYLKKQPTIVVDSLELTKPRIKYFLTEVVDSIEIRKDRFNIKALKKIDETINKDKPVLIFPEKEASYFGEISDFSLATAKLIKKQGKDVVVVKTNGSYLTNPRWGKLQSFRGSIVINFKTLLSSNQILNYSIEEIHGLLKEALNYNDFEWNRNEKYIYNTKNRALGLEAYIYVCPKCNQHQTLKTEGQIITCEHCGEIAHFNAYSLISGLEFDNLVEWSQYQKKQLPGILKNVVFTEGTMNILDSSSRTVKELDGVNMEINPTSKAIFVQNRDEETMFEINKIKGLTILRTNELIFEYKKIRYIFKLDDPMLVKDAIEYLMK